MVHRLYVHVGDGITKRLYRSQQLIGFGSVRERERERGGERERYFAVVVSLYRIMQGTVFVSEEYLRLTKYFQNWLHCCHRMTGCHYTNRPTSRVSMVCGQQWSTPKIISVYLVGLSHRNSDHRGILSLEYKMHYNNTTTTNNNNKFHINTNQLHKYL